MSKPAGGRVLRPEPETSSGALLRQPIAGRSRRVLLRAPDHQGPEPTDALTMHEDRWAYCSAGKSESHDWQPTGGISLEDVKGFALGHSIRRVDP